ITSVDNLAVGNITYDYNDTIPYGIVISQNPDANTQVPIGSSVDLVVSLGQPVVPDVVGMTEPNATTEITSVDNLTVGNVTYDYNDTIAYGLVISQDPDANTQVPISSSVTYRLICRPGRLIRSADRTQCCRYDRTQRYH
ncbi:MAG: PASTA domain-containing protein, partial [Planctomycetota bacterium]